MAGTVGFPRPIRTGTATPLTGRNTRLETMRIWSTSPAGCSNEGPIHHAMNLGPRTIRKRPAMMVSDNAAFDHFRKISRRSDNFTSVDSLLTNVTTDTTVDQ